MTFSSLKGDVQSYLERGFSLATDSIVYNQIPSFINMAERRVTREWKATGLVEVVTGIMTPSQAVYAKPDRWRDTVSINIGTGTTLETRVPLLARSYAMQPLLDDSNQTNWLTEYAPQVLLYATLAEATRFLKADERIPVWEEAYKNALAGLNAEDVARISDRDAFRTQASP
jgi:hypothetical protein